MRTARSPAGGNLVIDAAAVKVSQCIHCSQTIYYNGTRWIHAENHEPQCYVHHQAVRTEVDRKAWVLRWKEDVVTCAKCPLEGLNNLRWNMCTGGRRDASPN